MAKSNSFKPGKHFLQIPGPTNVPDRVLRAMDYPTIDHRGPVFADIAKRVLERVKVIFKTDEPVIIFPASGTGAWEASHAPVPEAGNIITGSSVLKITFTLSNTLLAMSANTGPL